MLKEGPISALTHGIIEYSAGLVLIVAPLLIDYESGTATAVSVVVGILILIFAAVSATPAGLIRQIPVSGHVALDFVFAAFLIASPFLFGFSSEAAPTAVFVVLGIAHLMVTIGTRFSEGSASPPRT